MPSHLHALLGFVEVEKLSKFMQGFKILSSKRIKKLDLKGFREAFYDNRGFRFWKPRYDELVVTSEKQFRTKLQYIHNNPVKGGLVKDPCDWYFSSASEWLTGRPGLVPIDKSSRWTP